MLLTSIHRIFGMAVREFVARTTCIRIPPNIANGNSGNAEKNFNSSRAGDRASIASNALDGMCKYKGGRVMSHSDEMCKVRRREGGRKEDEKGQEVPIHIQNMYCKKEPTEVQLAYTYTCMNAHVRFRTHIPV